MEAIDDVHETPLQDVGVLVVPSDDLAVFLTDRGPALADAKHHAKQARVEDWPLLVIAFRHDGPGKPLPKQAKSEVKIVFNTAKAQDDET